MSVQEIQKYRKILNESGSELEKEQIAAVNQNPWAIANIKNPSEAVQLAAVKHNGKLIGYIQNPSEAVKLAAVESNPEAFDYINGPIITDSPVIKGLVITFLMHWAKGEPQIIEYSGFDIADFYNGYKRAYPQWPEWKILEKYGPPEEWYDFIPD